MSWQLKRTFVNKVRVSQNRKSFVTMDVFERANMDYIS